VKPEMAAIFQGYAEADRWIQAERREWLRRLNKENIQKNFVPLCLGVSQIRRGGDLWTV
jgi:hypothetical protein